MKESEELEKLLYVELPNLIHRIIHSSIIPFPSNISILERTVNEIKKISNAECDSVLDKIDKLSKL